MNVFSKKIIAQELKNYPMASIGFPLITSILLTFLCDVNFYEGNLSTNLSLGLPIFLFHLLGSYSFWWIFFVRLHRNASFRQLKNAKEVLVFSLLFASIASPFWFLLAEYLVEREHLIYDSFVAERTVEVLFVLLGYCVVGIFFQFCSSFFIAKNTTDESIRATKDASREPKELIVFAHPCWQRASDKVTYLRTLPLAEREAYELEKVLMLAQESINVFKSAYLPNGEMLQALEQNLAYTNAFLDDLVEKYERKKLKSLKKHQEKLSEYVGASQK